ncbi:hypothetical protein BOTBODRAFT_190709 [Botryobasidium botryosum FD-172 SS1]|uniref:Uncharacterized protein n=1 Tax=Botryobasidium botryosum (strain FD-172 SS1) TaxID=930990 RepID=A0A067MDY4_BOTB1|nr:hypothetical protein BOTBODRAFT_190709 [Botryobasidium botryosum FD-172 SS1]
MPWSSSLLVMSDFPFSTHMDAAMFEVMKQALRNQEENDAIPHVENDSTHRHPSSMTTSADATLVHKIEEERAAVLHTYHHFAHLLYTHVVQRSPILAARRNKLSPIHRLPDEILSDIFEFATGFDKYWRPTCVEPLTLSQISMRWRDVALRTPRIWALVKSFNYFLAELFVARSKTTPLRIQLECANEFWCRGKRVEKEELSPGLLRHKTLLQKGRDRRDILRLLDKLLIPQIHRWESVRLRLEPTVDLELLLVSPAPLLEEFNYERDKGTLASSPIPLPQDLFAGHAPRLRTLSLSRAHLPLSSLLYSRLYHLALQHITFNSSLEQFVHALRDSPSLLTLTLKNITFQDESSPRALTPISLPNLETMLVELDPETLHNLFASIILPSTSCLEIQDFRGDLGPLFAQLKDNLPSLSNIRHLYISCCEGLLFYVVGRAKTGGPRLLDIAFVRRPDRAGLLALVRETAQVVTPSLVETLSLQSIPEALFDPAFPTTLDLFPEMSTLVLSDCPLPLLEALVLQATSRLCPRLSDLRLTTMGTIDSTLVRLVQSRTKDVETEDNINMARLARLTVYHDIELEPSTVSDMEKRVELSITNIDDDGSFYENAWIS